MGLPAGGKKNNFFLKKQILGPEMAKKMQIETQSEIDGS